MRQPLNCWLGRLFALPLVLCMGLAVADQNDPELVKLFEQLRTAPNAAEAIALEGQIWQRWLAANDETENQMMLEGQQAMASGNLALAIEQFSKLIEAAPEFAEGWNKRATAYYLAGDLAASMQDVERTLALEPRHFGAISGIGLILIRRGDKRGALDAFEKVLELNPNAIAAKAYVQTLRKQLEKSAI